MGIKKIITVSLLPLFLLGSNAQALDKKMVKDAGGKQLRWEIIQLIEAEKLRAKQAAGAYTGNPLLVEHKNLGKIIRGIKVGNKLKVGN